MDNKIWIGLVGVVPLSEDTIIGKAKGAFANILAFADSSSSYDKVIRRYLEDNFSLKVTKIEDVELFEERLKKFQVAKELKKKAKVLSETHEIQIGTLHTFNEFE